MLTWANVGPTAECYLGIALMVEGVIEAVPLSPFLIADPEP